LSIVAALLRASVIGTFVIWLLHRSSTRVRAVVKVESRSVGLNLA
jgi:hypothetical protein